MQTFIFYTSGFLAALYTFSVYWLHYRSNFILYSVHILLKLTGCCGQLLLLRSSSLRVQPHSQLCESLVTLNRCKLWKLKGQHGGIQLLTSSIGTIFTHSLFSSMHTPVLGSTRTHCNESQVITCRCIWREVCSCLSKMISSFKSFWRSSKKCRMMEGSRAFVFY